jgi:hypothetical protein
MFFRIPIAFFTNFTESQKMSQTVQASSIREGIILSAQNNYEATKTVISQSLIVHSYCQKLLMQPPINFGDASQFKYSEDKINAGLKKAQDNARFYMDKLRPKMIEVLANVRFFAVQMRALGEAVRKADSMAKILNCIKYPLASAQKYEQEAKDVAEGLKKFEKQVADDTAFYQGIVDELNALINGEEELLHRYQTQLKKIEEEIIPSSILVAGGVLGILSGAFLIAVGTISSFVTAGTSLPIAAVGGALLLGGIGSTAKGSVALAGLLDQKSALVKSINTVEREVKLAREYVTAFGDLRRGAHDSTKAAEAMHSTWQTLALDLKFLYDVLSVNSSDIYAAQYFFASSIDGQMNSIINSVNIIHGQMGGVTTESVSEAQQADWTAFAKQKVGVLV